MLAPQRSHAGVEETRARILAATREIFERNGTRGPNFFGFDLALARSLKLNEKFSLEIRAEAFNILNKVNFFGQTVPAGLPVSAFNAGTVSQGESSSTFGEATGAYDPRILQFSMKVHF